MYINIYEILGFLLINEIYDEETIIDLIKKNICKIVFNRYFYLVDDELCDGAGVSPLGPGGPRGPTGPCLLRNLR